MEKAITRLEIISETLLANLKVSTPETQSDIAQELGEVLMAIVVLKTYV